MQICKLYDTVAEQGS